MLIYSLRYLTKICDQVVALLSAEHTASIVWGDEDEDDESIDVDPGDDDQSDYSRMRSQSGMNRKRAHRHVPGFR